MGANDFVISYPLFSYMPIYRVIWIFKKIWKKFSLTYICKSYIFLSWDCRLICKSYQTYLLNSSCRKIMWCFLSIISSLFTQFNSGYNKLKKASKTKPDTKIIQSNQNFLINYSFAFLLSNNLLNSYLLTFSLSKKLFKAKLLGASGVPRPR